MAQTSYYYVLKSTQGHRYIGQRGTHAFAAGGKTVTLTLAMDHVLAARANPTTNALSAITAVCNFPVIPQVFVTQQLDRIIAVVRKTGTIAGMTFDYEVFGK